MGGKVSTHFRLFYFIYKQILNIFHTLLFPGLYLSDNYFFPKVKFGNTAFSLSTISRFAITVWPRHAAFSCFFC